MRRLLTSWAIALLAAGAYANTLGNQPVLDDGWVIFQNSLIKHLSQVGRIFREPYNVAGAATNAGLFRPITTLSYALNYAAGGESVWGYHLVNLLLHVACTLLVLLLSRRLAWAALGEPRDEAAACIAAALFAVHPTHVEAVTSMVGRAEELAAFFALGCVYLVATRAEGRWRLLAAMLCLAAGVLSKENAAVAPLLVAILAWTLPTAMGLPHRPGLGSPPARSSLARLAVLEALLGAGVAVYPLLVMLGPRRIGIPESSRYFGGQPLETVLATTPRLLDEYLRILVWPHPLGVDFYYSSRLAMATHFGAAQVGFTAICLSAVLAGLWACRRFPLEGVGILWIFASLLPVTIAGAMVTERFLYLPSAGFCLLVGSLASRVRASELRAAVLGAAVMLGLVLAVQRNQEWSTPLALWESELRKEPSDVVVNNNLAVEYEGEGNWLLAKERLEVALRTQPGYWRSLVNLGIVQHHLGDDDGALQRFAQARAIDPTASSPDYYAGMLFVDKSDFAHALPFFQAAASKAPLDAFAHYWYGRSLSEVGRLEEAREPLATAAQLDPANEWSRNLLALISQKLAAKAAH